MAYPWFRSGRREAYSLTFVKSSGSCTLSPVPLVYLDYNATTPLDPAVRHAMEPFLSTEFGNPSSIHRYGRAARSAVDQARESLAETLGCRPSEITFTSGGTESCNLAVFGVARAQRDTRRHLVVSAVEHPAVLAPARYLADHEGFSLTVVPVNSLGQVCADEVIAALRPDTALVSVMAPNNELGSVQHVAAIGAACAHRGVPFHCDASQWPGKLPLPSIWQFGASLISICAHKFGGPKGTGALIHRGGSGVKLAPLLLGGSQEADLRAGTENVASLVGLAAAGRLSIPRPLSSAPLLSPLAVALRDGLAGFSGVRFWSGFNHCLPNTVSFSFAGADSLTLLAALDLEGVCASSGSACSVGSLEPSHVLLAMGASQVEASALVRFSLGSLSSASDIETAIAAFRAVINRVNDRPIAADHAPITRE